MKTPTPLPRGSFLWAATAAAMAVLPLALVLPADVRWVILATAGLGLAAGLSPRALPALLRWLFAGVAGLLVLWLYGVGSGAALGRDVGSAALAVMMGMKLSETRSLRDARSVVTFALFAVMAAFLQDQGPLTLALALLAVLLILSALNHLAECEAGVPVPGWNWRQARSAGRHSAWIAVLSLPLAIVGFFLFPRLANPLWGLPQNSSESRSGLSDSMSPGDISSLFSDDSPALRVRFDAAMPAQSQLYWRGPVFTAFDGRRWEPGYYSRAAAADVTSNAPALAYEIEQEPSDRRFLLALDMPVAAPDGARLTRERGVLNARPLSSVVRNRLEAYPDYVLEPTMSRPLRQINTELPPGYNPQTEAMIAAWMGESPRPEDLIQRVLGLFNAEFSYSLQAPLLGRHSVDDFLFNTKIGYCEHFSSAFTVMMRMAGIPARVVTGYQGGFVNDVGGYLVVRQSDAHAWSEVWLEGRGWVRIDPTNAVAPERIQRGSDALQPDSAWSSALRPLFDSADFLRRGWNDLVLGFNAERQAMLLRPLGINHADWRELGIALGIAAMAALGLTMYWLLRSPGEVLSPVVRAWRRLGERLRRRGHVQAPSEPPLAFAQRVSAAEPDLRDALLSAGAAYSEWRYANRHQSAEAQLELRRRLDAVQVTRRAR